jgi:stearoyl-CoA desaturase (delta-9 desaturase)
MFVIMGSMAMQGPLINWVATHRRHHKYSDVPLDAHSPHWNGETSLSGFRGFWYGHVGWMFANKITNSALFAKDLLRDPLIVKLNRGYFIWVGLGVLLPTILGGLLTHNWQGACQGFLWGGLARIFLVHHVCWAISSVSHNYGSRPFSTPDKSTNNLWLALPSFGGTWHNNHHAFPLSPITGLMWWQLDIGGLIVRLLGLLGLAWNLKTPSRSLIESRQKRRVLTDTL